MPPLFSIHKNNIHFGRVYKTFVFLHTAVEVPAASGRNRGDFLLLKHILKKTLIAVATIWLIITISFTLVHTMPGNPIIFLIGDEGFLEDVFEQKEITPIAA